MRRRPAGWVAWAVNGAGVILFIVILGWGGRDPWDRILASDPVYLLLSFAAMVAWTMIAAARWRMLANGVEGGEVGPLSRFYAAHMAAAAFGLVVSPLVGSLGGRPALLTLSTGWSIQKSLFASLIDELLDLFALALMVAPALFGLMGLLPPMVALLAMAAMTASGFGLIWGAYRFEAWALRFLAKVEPHASRLPVAGKRLAMMAATLSQASLPRPKAMLQSYGLTMAMFALTMARHVWFVGALHLDIEWVWVSIGLPVAQLSLLFSITPGALGVFELGWSAVLAASGATKEAILSFVIGRRLFISVFIVALAIAGAAADRSTLILKAWRARHASDETVSGAAVGATDE